VVEQPPVRALVDRGWSSCGAEPARPGVSVRGPTGGGTAGRRCGVG